MNEINQIFRSGHSEFRIEEFFAGRKFRVSFDDSMFLLGNDHVLNRARITKFGLHIGTVTIVFSKGDESLNYSLGAAARR